MSKYWSLFVDLFAAIILGCMGISLLIWHEDWITRCNGFQMVVVAGILLQVSTIKEKLGS